MKRLYAPWRHDYVTKIVRDDANKNIKSEGCVFCTQVLAETDDTYFIVKRFKHCFIMMNLYPYSVGHLMVLPYAHKPDLQDLDKATRAEMMEAVSVSTQVLTTVLKCNGFNVGINLGIAGGGGIPSHVHIHVLPRWRGDTNFLETIGEVKLLTADFNRTFNDLKQGFIDVVV